MTDCAREHAWTRWQNYRDWNDRTALIHDYMYLVRITAGRIAPGAPASVERGDLVSTGAVGLVKAVDTYEPQREVKFETYAIALIRGAMLEFLRKEDWAPRGVRDAIRRLEQAERLLESCMPTSPTRKDLADHLGITVEEVEAIQIHRERALLRSLDDEPMMDSKRVEKTLGENLRDTGPTPTTCAFETITRETLTAAITTLPAREAKLLQLYYYRGLTFKEISLRLTPLVSESRIFQLHGQAIKRLRRLLATRSELFVEA
jgi:RNA polymerase sigma factor for flagellar operon FliA